MLWNFLWEESEYMKTSLTEKERKKALQRLYGKAPGMVALLIIFLVLCLSLLIVSVVVLHLFGGVDNLESGIIIFTLLLLIGGISLLFMSMLADYLIRSKRLQEQYETLPGWRKEKLLYLAHTYDKRDGICFDEDYIYGNLGQAKRGKETQPMVLAFLYIDIRELAWAYRVENFTAISTPHANQAYYCRENLIRFYTHDGTRFQGKSRYTDEEGLLKMIQQQNPNCRLGYRKEWEKEFRYGG